LQGQGKQGVARRRT